MKKSLLAMAVVAVPVLALFVGAESASAADAGGRAAVQLGRAYLGRA